MLLHLPEQWAGCRGAVRRCGGWWTQNLEIDKTARMKHRSVRPIIAAALFWAFVPSMAAAGDCVSHPAPLRLESDTVQWLIVIARGDECIQGLRGRTMIFESVSAIEQPKTGRVVLQGPSFHYYAAADAGSDSFRLLIAGTSMRMRGTSTVDVVVQVR